MFSSIWFYFVWIPFKLFTILLILILWTLVLFYFLIFLSLSFPYYYPFFFLSLIKAYALPNICIGILCFYLITILWQNLVLKKGISFLLKHKTVQIPSLPPIRIQFIVFQLIETLTIYPYLYQPYLFQMKLMLSIVGCIL